MPTDPFSLLLGLLALIHYACQGANTSEMLNKMIPSIFQLSVLVSYSAVERS